MMNSHLTVKSNVAFMKPVKAGDRVVTKAIVRDRHAEKNRTYIEVTSTVENELVFNGEFEMYRTKGVEEAMMKLAIDGMGGDNAPQAIVEGVLLALTDFPDVEIQLYGQEQAMAPFLKPHDRLQVIHCEEVIAGDDDPARAVRRKKDSSMASMLEAVAEGRADACLSAGNTGALMAGGLFKVGRIDGVARPALATTLPTIDGNGFLMLDLGANADAKPENLLQYAIMGDIYVKKVRGFESHELDY